MFYCRLFGLVGVIVFFSPIAWACNAKPGDLYEATYCEIIAKGRPHKMPSLGEFRRNDDVIQRLFLKRAIRGLKITLPASKTEKGQHSSVRASTTRTPPAVVIQKKTSQLHKNSSARLNTKKNHQRSSERANPVAIVSSLKDSSSKVVDVFDLVDRCRLKGRRITCKGDTIFELVENRASRHIEAQEFAESNKLSLPIFSGDIKDTPVVKRYLQKAFRYYLDKMIAVGLGGSTITFNKFEYIFYDAKKRNFDFVTRFEMMFDFLKEEKKNSGGVKAELLEENLAIDHCGQLDKEIIICSVTARNRVYLKRS